MNQESEWAALVRRSSDDFRRAQQRQDWDAASTAATRTIDACRSIVNERREQQRRRNRSLSTTQWLLGGGGNNDADSGDDQIIEHYLHIAEQMARAHTELRRQINSLLASQPARRSPVTIVGYDDDDDNVAADSRPETLEEWRQVHRQLEDVADLYTLVNEAVERCGPAVEALERNIEVGETAHRRAEAAIRHYHDRHVTVYQAQLPPERAYMAPVVVFVVVAIVIVFVVASSSDDTTNRVWW